MDARIAHHTLRHEIPMRFATLMCTAILLTACTEAGERDDMAADTIAADAAPAISTADVAGTWAMTVRPEGSDSLVVGFQLFATADRTAWRMKFDHRADTLAVRVLEVAGDSITTEFGPYSSALRADVTVTTWGAYRLVGDRLVGNAVARYDVTTADSVQRFRVEGTRTQ